MRLNTVTDDMTARNLAEARFFVKQKERVISRVSGKAPLWLFYTSSIYFEGPLKRLPNFGASLLVDHHDDRDG